MVNVFLTQNDGAILGPIARVLGWILNGIFEFLSNFGIENAGLCIIIFTFLVNALMIPLTIKQQKFTKLSSKMTPEINKINEKYKGKKDEASMQKQNLEMQAVYEKYGASPTSGCLPLLITFPIMFALYRVIYNIPAYVGSIKELYENIAVAMQNTDYLKIMTDYASQFTTLNVDKWGDISSAIPVNNLIDIMAQFNSAHWSEVMANPAFQSIKDIIATNSEQIMRINEFGFGLNIAEAPMQQIMGGGVPFEIRFAYLLIPVLAIVTQIISTKISMAKTPQSNNPNDLTATTMKSMNTTVPIMMGVMCLMIPVGVGIYIIAGSVFRIIQQFFVDKYMDTVDVEDLIEKNKEKQKKKKEKMGIDPNMSMEEVAKKRTSTMQDKAKMNTSKDVNTFGNISYKKGSISDYANMLSNKNGDKESR